MSARSSQIVSAVLIGVALALVVLVIATRNTLTTSEAEARETNLLQAYDDDEITRIRFERKTGSFTLTRTKMDDAGDASWNITEPLQEEAEPFGIQKIEGTLELASQVRRIKPEEVDRAAFGLDDPSLVVHVDMGDIKYRLRLGAPAATPEGSRYLEIAGENAPGKGVVIVSKSLIAELDAKVDDFRERYVMPYLSSSLQKLTLEGIGGLRKLRRADWLDGFRFDGMMGDARTSRAVFDRVLVQFTRTRAEQFMDPAAAEKALAGQDAVTVTMTPIKPNEPVGIVVVGGKCPTSDSDVIALRKAPDRVAACVPRSVLSGLGATAESLVDRTLFWMRPDEVESLDIRQGETHLTLDRKETGFVMRAPREGTVDTEAGNGRLEALIHAMGTVVESPDLARLGLATPYGEVTLRSSASDESKVRTETIQVSARTPDGRVYVKRGHDGVVLELARETARLLVADAALVRSRTLLDVPIADVSRIELEGPAKQSLARSDSGTWTLESPAGFTVDGALALELADALRTLSVERWVVDADDGTFGLGEPWIVARLSVKKGPGLETHVLRLGKPAGAGRFGSFDSDPGVFVVPRRVVETLTTLVLDRSPMMMDTSITAKVTLSAEGRTVTLEKRGEDFVQTDATLPLSEDAIHKIVETLSGLRAEAAVHVGPPQVEEGFGKPVLTVRIEREAARTERLPTVSFSVGAGDTYRNVSVQYVRVDGIAATYAVARGSIRALLDAL